MALGYPLRKDDSDHLAEAAFLTLLLRIADRLFPGMRRQFLRAVRQQRRAVDSAALLAAIVAQSVTESLNQMQFDLFIEVIGPAFRTSLQQAVTQAIPVASQRLIDVTGIEIVPDSVQHRAAIWAELHSSELVTRIGDDGRDTLRSLIADGLREGTPAEELAGSVRSAIGLTERQVVALQRYRDELLAAGRPEAEAAKLVLQYRDALLDSRAETIARTETVRAVNEAQRILWQEALHRGELSRSEWEREWVAILGDGRVCQTCYDLHGSRAPIDGAFAGGLEPGSAHVKCRCGQRLVKVGSPAPSKPHFVEPAPGESLRPAA